MSFDIIYSISAVLDACLAFRALGQGGPGKHQVLGYIYREFFQSGKRTIGERRAVFILRIDLSFPSQASGAAPRSFLSDALSGSEGVKTHLDDDHIRLAASTFHAGTS